MSTQAEKIDLFRQLHQRGSPVMLYNIWDVGSAKAVAKAGAQALATGSASVALANGYQDGEHTPLALVGENIQRIVDAVELPVTLDFESGYATGAREIETNVAQMFATGIVGINFEDQVIGGDGLYTIAEQCDRIAAARSGLTLNGDSGFLNARTDIFLKKKPADHTAAMVDEALARAEAYERAGADGIFVPGVADEQFIARLCDAIELPVNIIALPHLPEAKKLTELGASRISYGPVPYRQMVQWLEEQARLVMNP